MWRRLFPPPSTSSSSSSSSEASEASAASNNTENPNSSSNNHHNSAASSPVVVHTKKPAISKVTTFVKGLMRCVSWPRCIDKKGVVFPRCSSDPTPTSKSKVSDVDQSQSEILLLAEDLSSFAVTDKGSQELVKLMNESTVGLVLDRILDRILYIMCFKNGIKVIQSLCKFESCVDTLALKLLSSKPSDLKDVILDINGSYSVLELLVALNNVKSPLTHDMVGSLATFTIMREDRSEKLVMHCLNHLNSAANMALYQCAIDRLGDFAKLKVGERILARMINLEDNPLWGQLVTAICSNSYVFSQDANASHVIQHVLKLHKQHLDELICIQVRDHIMELSRHKYGWYVVRECLESSSMGILVNELLVGQRLYHLARVPHGYSVVKKAIETTQNTALFEQIEGALKEHTKALRGNWWGKSVYSSLTKARR